MNKIAKIFGYVLGDGWIDIKHQCGISGDEKSLFEVTKDIYDTYGYDFSSNIRTKRTCSPKYGISGTTSSFHTNTKFAKEMIRLGMPIGKRVETYYELPNWITYGDLDTKSSFLSGFYAAEGYIPSLQRNDKTPKPLSFCFYKAEKLVNAATILTNQFSDILKSLNIDYAVSETFGYTNKKVRIVTFSLSNCIEAFYSQLNLLDLNYCLQKEQQRINLIQYLDARFQKLRDQQLLIQAVKECRKNKMSYKDICNLYGITPSQVDKIISGKNKGHVLKNFPTFTEFISPILSN